MKTKNHAIPLGKGSFIFNWQFDLFAQASKKIGTCSDLESGLRILVEVALQVTQGREGAWGKLENEKVNVVEFYRKEFGWTKESSTFPSTNVESLLRNKSNSVEVSCFKNDHSQKEFIFYIPILNNSESPFAFLLICGLKKSKDPKNDITSIINALSGLGSKELNRFHEANEVDSCCNSREEFSKLGEKQLRFFADAMPQLVWIKDSQGKSEFYNERWYELTGQKVGDLEIDHWESFIHPEDRIRVVLTLNEAIASKKPLEITYRLRNRKGEYHWVLQRSLVVLGANEKFIKRFGTATIVDQQIKIARQADELHRIAAELSKSATFDEITKVITQHVFHMFCSTSAAFALVQEDGVTACIVGDRGLPKKYIDVRRTFHLSTQIPIAEAMRSKEAFFICNREEIAERFPEAARETGIGAIACLPIQTNGEVLGGLGLGYRDPQSFSSETKAFMVTLSNLCAEAIARSRLLEKERKARRESEEQRLRFRNILMSAPALISIHAGPNLVYELINPLAKTLIGNRDVIGKPFREAFPEFQGQDIIEAAENVYNTGVSQHFTEFPLFADWDGSGKKEKRYFTFTIQSYRRSNGEKDGIITIGFDVTEQVLARTIIENQQKWLEAVLNLLPVPIFFIEPGSGKILFSNQAASELDSGILPRNLANLKRFSDHTITDEYDRPLLFDQIPNIRAARGELLSGEPLALHTPTERYSFLVDSAFLPGMHGHSSTILMVYRDVTQLMKTKKELREAIEARDEFIQMASHQLKTPLTPIKLQTDNLKMLIQKGQGDKINPEKLTKIVDMCNERITHLTSIIEDILDVSRITKGELHLEFVSFNLSDLVRRVVAQFKESATRACCKVVLNIESPIVGKFDEKRIEQVIGHLLSNAIKYSPGSEIVVNLSKNHEIAAISVKDDGIGIPKEDLSRVFYRFERFNNTQKTAGLGLGLFISRRVVEAHQGKIWVQSELKKGSTFFIELPLNQKFIRRIK